jgi:hypothetical protein
LKPFDRKHQLYLQRVADATEGRENTAALYEMPMDDLKEIADRQLKERHRAELENFRTQTGATFYANSPEYRAAIESCPNTVEGRKKRNAIAQSMVDALDAQGLQGTVAELAAVFSQLVNTGTIQPPNLSPAPSRIYTEQELRQMPMQECERAIIEMSRNGIY